MRVEIQELKGQLEEAKEELEKLQRRNFDKLETTQKRGRDADHDEDDGSGGNEKKTREDNSPPLPPRDSPHQSESQKGPPLPNGNPPSTPPPPHVDMAEAKESKQV